ncbi:MAG: VWA domain-containing protein [Proteobacteria bacterium]|nr:MAG: VWA domain-containing protein [Pseudomonadota bacterium]
MRDLSRFSQEARELVRDAMQEAERHLTAQQIEIWLDGAHRLSEAHVGLGPMVSYLRVAPVIGRQVGEKVLGHIVATALSIAAHADATALEAFFSALPIAARRLYTPDALASFLDIVDELTALAPRGITPMFEHMGPLLEQVPVDGLRRWALLGVQGHSRDARAQDAWFRLESRDARAVLRSAADETLFSDVERRLTFYTRALWGRSIDLRAGMAATPMIDGEGKRGRRVSIVDGAVRMPQVFDPFPGQDGPTLYRAAVAHAAAHLVHSTQRFPLRELRPIQVALISLIEDARVEYLAMRELPGLARLWRSFHVALPSFTISAVSLMARLARALVDSAYTDDNPFVQKGRAMFSNAAADLTDPGVSRSIGNLLGNDLGQMRVQFNFKTYLVEPLYRDDNLFLWDLGDAGQRSSDDQDVIYQAISFSEAKDGEPAESEIEEQSRQDAEEEGAQTETGSVQDQGALEQALVQPHYYDEWDYAIGLDRPAWCTVLEKRSPPGDPHAIDEILLRNQETVDRLTNLIKAAQVERPLRLRRQLEGDKLDLDASIRATVDLRSGRTPDPRVHERQGKRNRDLAVLLLLDLSQSTNDYVPSAGTTVLNLAREATALVADAMEKIGDSFAIHGFDSNGRHEVEYYRFKDFDEPYSDRARARLAGMSAQLSTRMGTALRHAGHFLRYRRVARKLILLVTDGEPHDIDVHDRQYLLFDTKHAVEEQTRYGVATFCISLDPGADQYVARIFGKRNYLVLDHLRRLPEKLPLLYMRLTS